MELPDFDSLTLDPTGPVGNAWGLFGADDELGMLNLLTPEVIVAAAREVRTGVRIALDHPLDFPAYLPGDRQQLRHEMRPVVPGLPANDDVVEFNTQRSTQWDGFRHFGAFDQDRFFMGHKQKDFQGSSKIGVNAWLKNGGIQGRGVLVDWVSWAEKKGVKVDPFSSTAIPLSEIKQVLEDQKVEIRQGDILFIHSGVDKSLKALSPEQQKAIAERASLDFIGLAAGEETLRWIWSCKFAAVAGDTVGFEQMPPPPGNSREYFLHHWLLAGWGMPIGELFNLEPLAEHCQKTGRFTFFLSSVPLNVPGGVASPPNAVAIF